MMLGKRWKMNILIRECANIYKMGRIGQADNFAVQIKLISITCKNCHCIMRTIV